MRRSSVIHRSDGSGTTFNFTAYLSAVSAEWKLKAGSDLMVAWPTGNGRRRERGRRASGQGDAQCDRLRGVRTSDRARARARAAAEPRRPLRPARRRDVPGGRRGRGLVSRTDFHVLLTNPAGEQAYPIAATVFALMSRTAPAREDSISARFLPLVAAEGQRHRHGAGLRAPPARARAAGRSLLGTDLPGRELMPERALPAGSSRRPVGSGIQGTAGLVSRVD